MPVFIAYLERPPVVLGLVLMKSGQLAHAITKTTLHAKKDWTKIAAVRIPRNLPRNPTEQTPSLYGLAQSLHQF